MRLQVVAGCYKRLINVREKGVRSAKEKTKYDLRVSGGVKQHMLKERSDKMCLRREMFLSEGRFSYVRDVCAMGDFDIMKRLRASL